MQGRHKIIDLVKRSLALLQGDKRIRFSSLLNGAMNGQGLTMEQERFALCCLDKMYGGAKNAYGMLDLLFEDLEPKPTEPKWTERTAPAHHYPHDNGMTTHFICHGKPLIHDYDAMAIVNEAFGPCQHREYTAGNHSPMYQLRF